MHYFNQFFSLASLVASDLFSNLETFSNLMFFFRLPTFQAESLNKLKFYVQVVQVNQSG